MFSHSASFTIRPDKWDQVHATLGPAKAMIAAIPGLRLWLLTANPDTGYGVAIAVFESEEAQQQGLDHVDAMLSGFVDTLTAPWQVMDSQVLAFADNDWRDLARRHH